MLRIPSVAALRGSGPVASLPRALRGARAARSMIVGRAALPQGPIIRGLVGAASGPSVLTRPQPQAPGTTNRPIVAGAPRTLPSDGASAILPTVAPTAHEPVKAKASIKPLWHQGVITAPNRYKGPAHISYKPPIAPMRNVLRTSPEPPASPTKAGQKAQGFPPHQGGSAEVRLLSPKVKPRPLPASIPNKLSDSIGAVYRHGVTSTIYQDKKMPNSLIKVSFAKDDLIWKRYQRMASSINRYYGEGSAARFRGKDGTSYLSMLKVPGLPITDLPDSAKSQALDNYNILVQRLWGKGIVASNLHAGKVVYDPVTKRARPLAILRCKRKEDFIQAEEVINQHNGEYSTSPEIVNCKFNKNRQQAARSDLRWKLVNRDGEVLKESGGLILPNTVVDR